MVKKSKISKSYSDLLLTMIIKFATSWSMAIFLIMFELMIIIFMISDFSNTGQVNPFHFFIILFFIWMIYNGITNNIKMYKEIVVIVESLK